MTRTATAPRRFALAASAIAISAALGLAAAAPHAARAQQAPITVNSMPFSFADLIEKVSPAVVSVAVTTEVESERNQFGDLEDLFRQFRPDLFPPDDSPDEEPESREGTSLGSGFIISADGYIVTNNHVVADGKEVKVILKEGDQELDAVIVGRDEPTDIAVLKVKSPKPLPFVEFEKGKEPRVGDWVVALGNPFGLGGTATAGIISASGREIGGQYNGFLQIDAPINRGNSGGPTFDLNGRVIGVNSQIYSPSGGSVGIGFAIPAETAAHVAEAIIKDGSVVRGWLGVTIDPVTDDIAASLGLPAAKGAIVKNVVAGGPAEAAGFKVGDVVLSVEGDEVKSNLDLTRKVGDLRVGDRVRFRVLRSDKEQTLTAAIGKRPSNEELAALRDSAVPGEPPEARTAEFGLALSALDDKTREALSLDPSARGVLVTSVARDGAAAEKGLAAGDVVLEVGGQAVTTPAEFTAAVKAARQTGRTMVLLLVQSQGSRRFVALPLEAGDRG